MIKSNLINNCDAEKYLFSAFGSDSLFVIRAAKAQLKYCSNIQKIDSWLHLYLDNGGFFICPEGTYFLELACRSFKEVVSTETAGIISCLQVYKNLSNVDRFQQHYDCLKAYSHDTPDCHLIARAISDFSCFNERRLFSKPSLSAMNNFNY